MTINGNQATCSNCGDLYVTPKKFEDMKEYQSWCRTCGYVTIFKFADLPDGEKTTI